MSAILAVELRRALARRLARVLVILALLGIVLIAVVALINSGPDDPFSPDDIWPARDADESDGVLASTAFLFFLMALLGGGSFVGAEYKAGTTTTLLTWEPRRPLVVAAKLLAAGLVAGGAFLVLQAVLAAALAPAVATGETADAADGQFFRSLGGFLLRGSALTAGFAVLGASIAVIGKNTTAALGAALGYLVVAEQILRGLRPGWDDWLVMDNVLGVMLGEEFGDFDRSPAVAGLLLALYLALVVAAAVSVFIRRDVT